MELELEASSDKPTSANSFLTISHLDSDKQADQQIQYWWPKLLKFLAVRTTRPLLETNSWTLITHQHATGEL